jgi:hypothetical protein
MWAGDSRAYILSAKDGLQQLTKDDVKSEDDSLEALLNDPPISNCINADGEFVLNRVVLEKLPSPIMLLAATDGCFGYVQTPAHFERLLLQTLQISNAPNEWEQHLTENLCAIAGDDASMALMSIGWNSFTELKADFAQRLENVQTLTQPIDDLLLQLTQVNSDEQRQELLVQKQQRRAALWDQYRQAYEQKLKELSR